MFKSSFSKYLVAFVSIILLSFLMLSGIVTSMIRSYSLEEKRSKLEAASTFIASQIEARKFENLDEFITSDAAHYLISSTIHFDSGVEILILDNSGNILISTLKSDQDWNVEMGEGKIDISAIVSGEAVLSDTLGGYLPVRSLIYSTPINIAETMSGYILSVSPMINEDNLIGTTRRAVVNSSIWVMLAAVIAAYFITERLVNPLRNMTSAVRNFAKGELGTRVVISGRDEVAELGEAFNHMAESLQNLEKMRNSFLANVSHDLRTPMTTISGFIDGINSGAIPPEKHEYYLGIISQEVHRLSRLVSQLLDVSRLESGDRKFAPEDFDIAEMARIILISFEQKIEDKRLEVEFISDDDKMFANADKDAIHQVFYNLCHNAIKFSRDGGRFIIKIEHSDSKKLRVSVFDDGECLDGEDKERVFDRFYKTDKSRGLDKNGVGLGLYICKTIVEAHGENIGVISDEDGCEFWFTLQEGATIDKRLPKPRMDEN